MADGTHVHDSITAVNESSQTCTEPANNVLQQSESMLRLRFRSVENSRRFITTNLSSAIDNGIQPFIELSRYRVPWLPQRQNQVEIVVNHTSSDSHIIDMEEQLPDLSEIPQNVNQTRTALTYNFVSARETENPIVQSNRNENSQNEQPISSEARAIIKTIQKCFPFAAILLAKGIYDHITELLNLFILTLIFDEANYKLKREITKQDSRSFTSLAGMLFYIFGYFLADIPYVTVPEFPLHPNPTTVAQLLWTVAMMDFALRLLTVAVKVCFTCLPARLVALPNRGKYYVLLETASQLLRSCAPIQPLFFYLYNMYNGPAPILGIILFTICILSKGNNLLSHLKLLWFAVCKMTINTCLGEKPSKDQIYASGGICAICQDEYMNPVKLRCNHIFCELCVLTWLDRERSCPFCRALVADDPIYRDGHTTYFVQLF